MTTSESATSQLLLLGVHELRTPVTVAAGYIRMVLREQAGPISEKQRKLLDEVEKSCGKLAALVADMSELAKLDAGEIAFARQPVPLGPLLSEVAANMHEGSDRGVRLELDEVPGDIVTRGDRTRLRAALTAIIHATMRERGEPGIIRVRVRRVAAPAAVHLAVGDDEAAADVLAAPQDTPFDEWRGGVGFSLPLARRIIAAHGGRVWSLPGAWPRRATGLSLPLES